MDKKVLVVDDDEAILYGIKTILKDEGYSVIATTKGDETYAKVRSFKPDLVLLDVLLSGEDGRTICKKLSLDNKSKQIPVILISAEPSLRVDGLKYGAKDFLAKPFETSDLVAMVKKHIS